MFQTEINLWLQSFSWPPVGWLLTGVSLLGYAPVYVALLLVLAFAFRLRPSLAVMGGVLLAGLLTSAAKDSVALPRPDEVDSRIRASRIVTPMGVATRGGATGFWALPAPEAIAAVRARASGDYGFPSGHVGVATAFLLCSAAFYRSRRALVLVPVWVPLMALSRLYLGRHFLADVLGGLGFGLVATGLALVLFRPLDERASATAGRKALVPLVMVGALLLGLTPFVPVLDPRYVGAFGALVLSTARVVEIRAPLDGGPLRLRARRVLLAAVVFAGAGLAAKPLLSSEPRGARLGPLVVSFGVLALSLEGTVALARRRGWHASVGPKQA